MKDIDKIMNDQEYRKNLLENYDLSKIINNQETLLKDYKYLMREAFVNKHPDWYKEILREDLNHTKKWLKELIEEKSYENVGLNPPFCYNT